MIKILQFGENDTISICGIAPEFMTCNYRIDSNMDFYFCNDYSSCSYKNVYELIEVKNDTKRT